MGLNVPKEALQGAYVCASDWPHAAAGGDGDVVDTGGLVPASRCPRPALGEISVRSLAS